MQYASNYLRGSLACLIVVGITEVRGNDHGELVKGYDTRKVYSIFKVVILFFNQYLIICLFNI